MGTTGRVIAGIWAAATLLMLLPASASAQRYASTTGTAANSCAKADPCDIITAVEGAADGFDVYILPGTYTINQQLDVLNTISVTGAGTARTVINSNPPAMSGQAGMFVTGAANDAVVQDLTVNSTSALDAFGIAGANAEVNRVIARTATGYTACSMYRNATLRDSMCTSPNAYALLIGSGLSDGNYTVRNVTAYNSGAGIAIEVAAPEAGIDTTASLRNTIADAPAGVGLRVSGAAGATSFAGIDWSFVSSDSVAGTGGRSFGPNGTSLPPLYVNAPSDLHLTAASGLRNRGTRYYASAVDVDGDLRTQEGTSIGADEYIAPPVVPDPDPVVTPPKKCKKGQKLKKGKCVKKKKRKKKGKRG